MKKHTQTAWRLKELENGIVAITGITLVTDCICSIDHDHVNDIQGATVLRPDLDPLNFGIIPDERSKKPGFIVDNKFFAYQKQ